MAFIAALTSKNSEANLLSVLVDDFYLVGHGADDAISVRLAVAYALANNIPCVRFLPRVYNLTSNVSSTGISSNSVCSVKITSSTWSDLIVLDGNGATLAKAGTDFADIIHIKGKFKNIRVRGLKFIRDHLETPLVARCGLVISTNDDAFDVDSIEIIDCVFSDCNRPIEIGTPTVIEAHGKCKNIIVRNCLLLYPRGSNFNSSITWGGGQAMLISSWAKNFLMEDCFFDGAVGGNIEGIGNERAVDGMGFFHAINQTFRRNKLTHFEVEGIYATKQPNVGSASHPFTVPAIGQTFLFTFWSDATRIGWKVNDRIKLCNPGTYVFTHEFKIIALVGGRQATVEVISGAAGLIDNERWLNHPATYNIPTTAKFYENECYDTLITTADAGGAPCIALSYIDEVTIINNKLEDCQIGVYAREGGAYNMKDNYISCYNTAIVIGLYTLPSILENNEIVLYRQTGTSSGDITPYAGINSLANSTTITGGSISMGASISGRGIGITIGDGTTNSISGVTFTNLDVDYVPYNGWVITSYTGNTRANVAHPYTP